MAAATPPAAAGKLECVLFDIDNTLANSTTLAFGATNKVLELAGYPAISMAQYLEGTKHTTPRRLAWHATGDVEAAVGEELGAQFDDLYIGMVSPETAGFYPGLLLLVEEIAASHRVGALSNACGRYVREVLSANGVSPLFAVQLGADEVPAAKPSPAGLRQCCEAMGLGPEACVYVGDAPSDGLAARAAGMRSVGVSWGAHSREQLEPAFDALVDTPAELRLALKGDMQ